MNADKRPLLQALRLNALFSGTSALLMFLSAGWIAAQLGLESALPVYAVAAVLVLFALQLGNVVRTAAIRSWEIMGIIVGDLAWVVASVVLVAVFYEQVTTTGLVLVDAVAIAVLFFAIRQYRGLRVFRHGASA